MMQRLVRVSSVETRLDQSAREILRRRDIARHAELPVVRLIPHVVRRRRELERLVRVDAVRRNHILAKIFVLIVAPHDDEVGTKRVDLRARLAQRLAAAARDARAPRSCPRRCPIRRASLPASPRRCEIFPAAAGSAASASESTTSFRRCRPGAGSELFQPQESHPFAYPPPPVKRGRCRREGSVSRIARKPRSAEPSHAPAHSSAHARASDACSTVFQPCPHRAPASS